MVNMYSFHLCIIIYHEKDFQILKQRVKNIYDSMISTVVNMKTKYMMLGRRTEVKLCSSRIIKTIYIKSN